MGTQVTPLKGAHPQFSADVYCGQTVVHLSYCWALVLLSFGVHSLFHPLTVKEPPFWNPGSGPGMDTKLWFVLADILCLQCLVGCFSSKLLSQTACLLNEDSRPDHQQSDTEVECNWLYHKRIGQIMSAYIRSFYYRASSCLENLEMWRNLRL